MSPPPANNTNTYAYDEIEAAINALNAQNPGSADNYTHQEIEAAITLLSLQTPVVFASPPPPRRKITLAEYFAMKKARAEKQAASDK